MSNDLIDKKQKLLIEYLISDKEVFVKCYHILKEEYFESPLDKVIGFILTYFKKHMNVPNVDIIDAETGIYLKNREIDKDEIEYLLEEIEEFCKTQAATNAVLDSVDLINEGRVGEIQEVIRRAMLVRLDKSLGKALLVDPKDRIESVEENLEEFSTGLPILDQMIGNLRRAEFGMVYAISSGGKSLMLANIAHALMKQGLNGVIITLELKEDLYCNRMDAIITDTSMNEVRKSGDAIESFYNSNCQDYGNLIIKKMPAGSTVSEIEAYLMEYTLTLGESPDFILTDYLQLMSSDLKSDNKFDTDHEKALGLIRMGEYHDAITISAGQINREGYDILKVNPSHCAGGLSVINDSDWSIALVATEEDLENNQVQISALKIRHARRTKAMPVIYKDPESLIFSETPSKRGSSGVSKTPMVVKKPTNKEKLRKSLNLGKR